jgi:nucleoside-diphosphate-sugar epimerase
MADQKTVLVTGGNGYIGAHIIVRALSKGYRVRTTVRSEKRIESVLASLHRGGISEEMARSVVFVEADLLTDRGWDDACQGCDFVLHVASPFPMTAPETEDEIIKPAREGTLRVLCAAKKAGTVQRVVVTSSFAAVGYGHGKRRNSDNPFTENDWSAIYSSKGSVGAYEKSKTLAERAAWQWMKECGGDMELAVVNPVDVYGPTLSDSINASLELPRRMLSGELPGLPDLHLGIVDVRDVADLHILVMESASAAGERYLAISNELSISIKDIAICLRESLPPNEAKKISTRVLPNFFLRQASYFDKSIALILPDLGIIRPATNIKARQELGWAPRSARDAIIATAESLRKNGLVGA